MKRGSTLFLRATVIVMGLMVLILYFLAVPAVYEGWVGEYPKVGYMQYPVIFGLTATAIPFFIALYQALKLLNYIDKNKAFSLASVKALGMIKYCGFVIGGVYAAGMPVVYHIADIEDAPGVVIIGLFFTFAPIVIAVFAAVAQRLFQNAIDIKSENDLTV